MIGVSFEVEFCINIITFAPITKVEIEFCINIIYSG